MVEKICDCGIIVKGTCESILKMNMVTHKGGKKHKEAMKIKSGNLEKKDYEERFRLIENEQIEMVRLLKILSDEIKILKEVKV